VLQVGQLPKNRCIDVYSMRKHVLYSFQLQKCASLKKLVTA